MELLELRHCKTSAEYRVGKQISKGSYGDVFLAERLSDGRQVCLKQVDLDFISPHERLGCLAEVRLLQSLPRHVNVVACYDAFWAVTRDPSSTSRIIIALEYGDCGDVDAFIQAECTTDRAIPLAVALDIFAQITSGLEFLHSRHILHRDIKSKNVFRFGDGRVVIGDFGTSKSLTHTLALANTLVGSPLYMSPEVLEDQPYSFSSDVWSLGCVLYELLTGRTPFAASSYPAVVFKITKGVFDPLPPSYPAEVHELIARLLSLDPSQRPTVSEILETQFVRQYTIERVVEASVGETPPTELAHSGVKPVDMEINESVATLVIEEDVHVVLPPPAPVVQVKADTFSPPPQEPPPPPKPTRVQQKPRSSSPVFPTDRSRLADILSKERLNVHNTPRQPQDKHQFLSCVPLLDVTIVEKPAPQHAQKPQSKPIYSAKSKTSSLAKPCAAVPLENMMIIGTKVHSARASTLQAKDKLK